MHTRTKQWLQNSRDSGHKVGKCYLWNCVRPSLLLQSSGLASVIQVDKGCQGADRYRRRLGYSRGAKANSWILIWLLVFKLKMEGVTSALVPLSPLPPAHGAAPASGAWQGRLRPLLCCRGLTLSFSSAELRLFRVEHRLLSPEPAADLQNFQASKAMDGFTRV